MKILVIGDVTSPSGIEYLGRKLWKFRKENGVDFCVVNGENASFISGITDEQTELLIRGGADCITGGNHTMHQRRAYTVLDERKELLRPANYGDRAPGRGYTVLDCNGYRILVMNVMGVVHIEPTLDSPFNTVDKILREMEGKYDFSVLDVHAEATGEKLAIAHCFDGRVNIVFGTHTHVPTADEQILPRGTGYITDVGMCGESGGILGMEAERVVERMRTRVPYPFKVASGDVVANGVIFTLNTTSGKITDIERIKL